MNGVLIEAAAAIAVGLFVVFVVLQPMLSPDASALTPVSPIDDLVDPEETPEGAAVSALREIEFDRATGKLSDEDYLFLKTKYTGLAVQALRTADAGSTAAAVTAAPSTDARAAVERLVAFRAGQLGAAAMPVCDRCGPAAEADACFCSTCGDALGTAACRACGTPHLHGGRYCDHCGTRLADA